MNLKALMVQRERNEMMSALERARQRSHRLPDGRYVLPIDCWAGMKIETPKIWDYKERKDAVMSADLGKNFEVFE